MPPRKTNSIDEVKEQVAKELNDELIHKNMRFYGKVQDTPKEAQKSFDNGRFKGTDINPMWRIKKLTEVFGPAGFGWWTQNVKYRFENADITPRREGKAEDDLIETAVFCELELVVVDPDTELESKPIYGVGGNTFVANGKFGRKSSDEAMKMAYTDALSIACKALGFSHDIYYQADRTKYTAADINSGDNAPSPEELKALTDRIKKGIDIVTKNMDAAAKDKFAQDVIVKYIGTPNYVGCKDINKLNALLNELLTMAKKAA